ncbi:hypothetical protein [Frateuria defendens]|uniref:hypothetical protein n=1 Tax=Frateuria defendens TaxID=2219559 RepID=UPI001293F76F|nr:hypothetical protein [Frateuria defendens]
MKKRFSEEQIIGSLREAEAGLPAPYVRIVIAPIGTENGGDDERLKWRDTGNSSPD